MKALLDEQLDVRMKKHLSGLPVQVFILHDLGWIGLKNGELITQLRISGFQFLVTADKNLPFQYNLDRLESTLVLLDTPSLDWSYQAQFVPKLSRLFAAVPEPLPKIVHIGVPGLSTGRKRSTLIKLIGEEHILFV